MIRAIGRAYLWVLTDCGVSVWRERLRPSLDPWRCSPRARRTRSPRTRTLRPFRADAGAHAALRELQPADAAVARRDGDRVSSVWAASGAPERKFWEAPGVYSTAVGIRGRVHAQPDVRGGVLGPHRPHRGRARRVRSGQGHRLRAAAQGVLGGPRPDPGHAPGQRRRHAVPLGASTRTTTRSEKAAEASATRTRRRSTRPATARSRPRSRDAGPFYYAESYHQQYLAKNPNGYCGLGGTGVSCPVGLSAT